MEMFSIQELRQSEKFLAAIRWDIRPKQVFEPRITGKGKKPVSLDGNMFYVDIVYNRPTLVIMRNRGGFSKTVGFVEGVPENLLKEAMHCSDDECISGMYPITVKIENWLKKELGAS